MATADGTIDFVQYDTETIVNPDTFVKDLRGIGYALLHNVLDCPLLLFVHPQKLQTAFHTFGHPFNHIGNIAHNELIGIIDRGHQTAHAADQAPDQLTFDLQGVKVIQCHGSGMSPL